MANVSLRLNTALNRKNKDKYRMQFSALIEYLITGIVSSVWFSVLVNKFVPIPMDLIKDYKEIVVVVYIPIAYALGVYIDVVSSYFIRRFKELYRSILKCNVINKIHKLLSKFFLCISGNPKSSPYKHASIILSYSPSDMVKTMDAYVSRDRMARGMALNSLISAFVFLWILPDDISCKAFIICSVLFLLSISIWHRLRRLSSAFKKVAIEALKNTQEKP
jgi:ABC-type branched-subunit amino acid transport system permease subunit